MENENQPRRPSLEAMFRPRSIALIGASEKMASVGLGLCENLSEFPGECVYVNPRHDFVLGKRSYPDLASTRRDIDLAVIAVPAPAVPGVVRECVRARVPAAVIVSSGFREAGQAGVRLEQAIAAEAKHGHLRILGPNCLGLINPHAGLNASFAVTPARKGHLAFLSQSGALGAAILDWSHQQAIGFSAFVSMGSMMDLGWGELIRHFGRDPNTASILLYMESIGDIRSFVDAAREVAPKKPIIVLKAGRTQEAARATVSHTGAMTGSDKVADALMRRLGILRADTVEELFGLAELLNAASVPAGPRLTIVTNAGGPGALATDALVLGGGKMAKLSADTKTALNTLLPAHWSHGNPIDVGGDSTPQRFAEAVTLAAKDPETDGLLTILTPQSMTDPEATARWVVAAAAKTTKPIFAAWMGGEAVTEGRRLLRTANIPVFDYPEMAARAFCQLARYGESQRQLRTAPLPTGHTRSVANSVKDADSHLIESARGAGRTLFSEYESLELLTRHGLPCVSTRLALSAEEAVVAAEHLHYPVVMKLHSRTLTHKSDVGGVELNLQNESAVRDAWWNIRRSLSETVGLNHFLGVTVQPMISGQSCEMILGSSSDPDYGPIILFGTGGKYTEIYNDIVLALPPLDRNLARQLLDDTKIGKILRGARGDESIGIRKFERLITQFSDLLLEQPGIREIDLNPVVWSGDKFQILDARIVLHPLGHHAELPISPVATSRPQSSAMPSVVRALTARDRRKPNAAVKKVDVRRQIIASGSAQRVRARRAPASGRGS